MKASETRTITLFIDDVRSFAFISLLVLLLVGFLITKYATNVLEQEPTILFWWFGMTNMCIVLDYNPSTFISPTLSFICLIAFILTNILQQFRDMEAYMAGKIGRFRYSLLSFNFVVGTLIVIFFLTSFAVSPDVEDLKSGNPVSLFIHTAPYICFVIYLSMVSVSESVYDLSTGWASFRGLRVEDSLQNKAWYILTIVPILVGVTSIFKVLTLSNAMAKPPRPLVPYHIYDGYNSSRAYDMPCLGNGWPSDPTCSGAIWCSNCPNFTPLVSAVDKLWLFMVLAYPLAKSLFLSIFRRDRAFHLSVQITPNYFHEDDKTEETFKRM